MFTLQNFETQIDPVILQRGQEYFSNKAVCSLEETGEGGWLAIVEGTDTYQVAITLQNQKKIKSYACDCPYDGAICKHVVAVLLALRRRVKVGSSSHQKKSPGNDILENLLQNISLQEYQAFIRYYVKQDDIFKTDFELYFASKDVRIDIGKKYKERVRKLIHIFSERGFVRYQDTFPLATEINAILETCEAFLMDNKLRQAFIVASIVLEEMMQVMPDCDDSAANIAQTIDEAINLIGIISAAAEDDHAPLQEQMLQFLQKKIRDPLYFDYGDFGYNLFSVFTGLALDLHQTELLLSFINAKLAKSGGEYEAYNKEYFLIKKIELLTALGRSQEADNLIWKNLDVVAVRKGEVEKALTREDYPAAMHLITEGMRIAQALNHPGTVDYWEKELLRLAVLQKDTQTIRDYTLYFAFNRGFQLEYYQQWKATYSKKEWPAVIDQYIADTTQRKIRKWEKDHGQPWQFPEPPLLQKLAPVYIQEKYWDQLLALVQQETNLDTILNYHQYLVPHFPAELLILYLPALEKYGQETNGRSGYARLAAHMKMVMEAIPAGKEQILDLARRLQVQYARRPAMVQELNKVLK